MGGSSGGGGFGGGGLITSIASSVANVGAGWFASRQLNAGARAQGDYQNAANALYRDLYDQTQADYAPFTGGGGDAYTALLRTYGIGTEGGAPDYSGFQDSPDYQFTFQQGLNALDRSAAARGGLYSGAQMRAAQQYGQGMASTQLDNYRRGLYNTAGLGLQGTNAMTNYRQGYGNQLGQGMTNLGDIEMARRLGRANINYRNVAAQDQIWGAYSGNSGNFPMQGNALRQGGGQSSYQSGGGQNGSGYGWSDGGWY